MDNGFITIKKQIAMLKNTNFPCLFCIDSAQTLIL